MRKGFYFLVVGLFCLNIGNLLCDDSGFDGNNVASGSYKKHTTLFSVSIGYPLGTGSPEFLDLYHNRLGGNANEFKVTPEYTLGAKISFNNKWRFGATFSFSQPYITEGYSQIEISGDMKDTITRNISQNIQLTNMPFLLTAELTPVIAQFMTYIGVGAGVTISNLKWNENLTSNFAFDKRTGGLHYNKTLVSPALRLYSGVELDFDKRGESAFLGGLNIEAGFMYIFRTANFFDGVKSQFAPVYIQELGKSYTILPTYLSLSIGLSFSFTS